MFGRIRLKRFLRCVAGLGEILARDLPRPKSTRQACIFYYHRVAEIGFIDSYFDDRNVSTQLFEKHLAALSEFAEILPLAELYARLKDDPSEPVNGKPLVSLTFDDGYANFRQNVLPLLQRYNAPATLSIVTSYVDSRRPAPFDRWAQKNISRISPDAWRMLNWQELEECVASGLVQLGAHSHSHWKANECTPEQLHEEAETSAGILRARFGEPHAEIYAYPFGSSILGHVSESYEKAVRSAGFKMAVTTDTGLVTRSDNQFRLPRLEAHDQDSAATLLAKSSGAIAPLYLNDLFHRTLAWRRNRGDKKLQTIPQAKGERSNETQTGLATQSQVRGVKI